MASAERESDFATAESNFADSGVLAATLCNLTSCAASVDSVTDDAGAGSESATPCERPNSHKTSPSSATRKARASNDPAPVAQHQTPRSKNRLDFIHTWHGQRSRKIYSTSV